MNNVTFRYDDITSGMSEAVALDSSNGSLHNITYDPMFIFYRTIIVRINIYAYPAISLVGLTGNCLAFITFMSLKLRKTSCNLYLASRTVMDSGLLLLVFLYWLERFDIFLVNSDTLCRLVTLLSYIFAFLSVWLVVAVTSENYVRICHPFRATRFCTVEKAKKVIIVLALISCVLYNFAIWTTQSSLHNNVVKCHNNSAYSHLLSIMTYVDTFVTFLLPSILMVFMVISIFYNSFQLSKRRSSTTPANQNNRRGRGDKKRSDLQSKVTRMLLAVSLVFLVLNLPLHVFRIQAILPSLITGRNLADMITPSAYLINNIFLLLYYISAAINCLLYLVCGITFRNEFIKRFYYCNHAQQRTNDADSTERMRTFNDLKKDNEYSLSLMKRSVGNESVSNDMDVSNGVAADS